MVRLAGRLEGEGAAELARVVLPVLRELVAKGNWGKEPILGAVLAGAVYPWLSDER